MEEAFLTDEDRMIARLQLHRDTADFICSALSDHGIKYERTRGNSPLGDILIIDQEDTEKAQAVLKSLDVRT